MYWTFEAFIGFGGSLRLCWVRKPRPSSALRERTVKSPVA
jgi:hypothetical protein